MFSTAHRTADPWPRWPENALEWDILDWQVIRRVIQYEKFIDAHPARPFPAKVWMEEHHPQPEIRIDTSKLPVMPAAFWHEEQEREQEVFQEEVRQLLAEQQTIKVRIPRPRRKRGRFERFLDKLIDLRTGANKIKPDAHVYQKAPFAYEEPEEVWAPQESWAR